MVQSNAASVTAYMSREIPADVLLYSSVFNVLFNITTDITAEIRRYANQCALTSLSGNNLIYSLILVNTVYLRRRVNGLHVNPDNRFFFNKLFL